MKLFKIFATLQSFKEINTAGKFEDYFLLER